MANHKAPQTTRQCPTCGATFTRVRYNRQRYCSLACANQANPARWVPTVAPEARFWGFVRRSDGCWEWQAARDKDGYGLFTREHRRMVRAHRYSWEIAHGPPGRLHVLHACDNPPCVRPDHLFLGTEHDNVADCVAKGRRSHIAGGAHYMAGQSMRATTRKLTPDQVREIRRRAGSVSNAALGREYGVTSQAIGHIIARRQWKGVD